MNTLLDPAVSVLRDVLANSAKASLLACAVALTCLLLRRWLSPGWRHVLWCAVFLRLVLPDLPVPGWSWNLGRVIPDTAIVPATEVAAIPLLSADARSLPATELAQAATKSESMAVGQEPLTMANSVPPVITGQALSIWRVLGFIWISGTFVWWAALGAGWWRFRRRVLANCTPATAQAQSLLAACMADVGMRARVDLRCSAHIATPAVCGITRHHILLPASLESAISPDDLRLLLLHELGHVKRHDSVVQLVASVLLGLHWWNPFLWLAWRQLRHEAEAATDAWVLQRTGEKSAPSYGAMLLTLASRACAAGVAMGLVPSLINATSNGRRLKRRILDIAAHQFARRWAVVPGVAVLACLVMAGFSQEPPKKAAEPKPAAEGATADSIGGVIVDENGQPIAGAEIEVTVVRSEGRFAKSVLPAGYNGPAPVKSDSEGKWHFDGVPTGVVPGNSDNVAEGRDMYRFSATHPEYLSREFTSNSSSFSAAAILDDDATFRKRAAKLVLQRGYILRGMVRDEDGLGVSGAEVQRHAGLARPDASVITDAHGNYVIKAARAGNLAMRILATGYATHMQRVEVKADTTQDFTLKRAQTLKLRIQDENGKPVSGYTNQRSARPLVSIYPSGGGWKTGEYLWRSVESSEAGTVVWEEAASGELEVEIDGRGFARVTRKVTANGGEVVITLDAKDRLPTVTLTVIDAATGTPLPSCTFDTGMFSANAPEGYTPTWMSDQTGIAFKSGASPGEYQGTLRDSKPLVFCVRHPGYIPVITPRVVVKNGEATMNVALQKGEPTEIVVCDVKGTPIGGADVFVAWQTNFISFRDFKIPPGSYSGKQMEFIGATDAEGRCSLPPSPSGAAVLVTHPEGFAAAALADLARSPMLRLGLYAQVEATVTRNGKPASGEKLTFGGSFELPGNRSLYQSLTAVSDAQGHISLPRVLPVRGAFREPQPRTQPGRSFAYGASGTPVYKPVAVGQTTSFEIELKDSKSRSLMGRFVMQGGGAITTSRNESPMVNLVRPGVSGIPLPVAITRLDEEGRFAIDGVAPGEYSLAFSRVSDTPPRFAFPGGKTSFEVSVPEATAETAGKSVDLGEVELVEAQKKDK